MNDPQPSDDEQLRALAEEAGVAPTWYDYRGTMHTVGSSTLRTVLAALGLPADSPEAIANGRMKLATERDGLVDGRLPPLVTVDVDAPIVLPPSPRLFGRGWRLTIDDGDVRTGRFDDEGPPILPAVDRFGYHRLEVDAIDGDEPVALTIAVAPTRCYGVADASVAARRNADERPWGLAAQIYSLRADGDGGLGHYGALATLARHAAARGADALAISPVHAMFSADLHRFSPYGPSSRLLANVLHVDPRGVLDDATCDAALVDVGGVEALAAFDDASLVDWPESSRLRLGLLRALFDRFVADRETQAGLHEEFDAFRERGGDVLEAHARFEALHAALSADDPRMLGGWRQFPPEFRDPTSDAVERFAVEHATDIAFHAFLQWQAQRQLAHAQEAARAAGMSIGIVADLAVGADGQGSQTWSRQDDMLIGLSIGAPPDLLNGLGQSWGLAAFSPRALRATGFRPWIDMLRAAFAHAGGIRIDHVLGLTRMWLVPDGADAVDGAYVRYPFDDLLRLVALESWRHRAVVIGEDLGTVPEGLPERLAAAGLMGIRVLWFERRYDDDGQPFKRAAQWSDRALAVTTTHDLPTTAGWWCERDIDWRVKLDLFAGHSSETDERQARERDRNLLWDAMRDSGAADGDVPPRDRPPIAEALRFIGRSPAPLAIVPIEDALGVVEQPNLPGKTDEHPNWRMRLPEAVDRVLDGPAIAERLAAFADGRAAR